MYVTNSTPITPVTPTNTSSIVFDGSQNYLTYPGLTIGAGAFTIQVWFNSNSFSNMQTILGATNPSGVINGLSLQILNSSQIRIDRLGNNNEPFNFNTILPNTWYYLVFVKTAFNIATFYLGQKGSAFATRGVDNNTGSGIFSDTINYNLTNNIGAWSQNGDGIRNSFFDGYLNNLCITSGALFDPSLHP